MLNIINNLKYFFEECYRRINVREYSRLMKISPPTASKLLEEYHKKSLLEKVNDRNYIFYYANKKNRDFIDLSRIYWRNILSDLTNEIIKKYNEPTIILFGSLSKAETKKDSDIDICIISPKKDINIKPFEKKLKRKIQILQYNTLNDINNQELKNNIINGYVLNGRIKI